MFGNSDVTPMAEEATPNCSNYYFSNGWFIFKMIDNSDVTPMAQETPHYVHVFYVLEKNIPNLL